MTKTTTPAWSWMTWRYTSSRHLRISGSLNRRMPAGGRDSSSTHVCLGPSISSRVLQTTHHGDDKIIREKGKLRTCLAPRTSHLETSTSVVPWAPDSQIPQRNYFRKAVTRKERLLDTHISPITNRICFNAFKTCRSFLPKCNISITNLMKTQFCCQYSYYYAMYSLYYMKRR